MNTTINTPHQSINILAFDTSMDEASVAIWTKGKRKSVPIPLGRGAQSQAACLLPVIQDLLARENLDFKDLHVVATPVGPGSFTGIRLGLATAQGLALSTQAASFAPTTFQVFAFNAWQENKESEDALLITLPTKRDSFYCQIFNKDLISQSVGTVQTEEEIQDFLNTHAGVRRIAHLSAVSAEVILDFYFHFLKKSKNQPHALKPYYVHDPEFVKQKRWSL